MSECRGHLAHPHLARGELEPYPVVVGILAHHPLEQFECPTSFLAFQLAGHEVFEHDVGVLAAGGRVARILAQIVAKQSGGDLLVAGSGFGAGVGKDRIRSGVFRSLPPHYGHPAGSDEGADGNNYQQNREASHGADLAVGEVEAVGRKTSSMVSMSTTNQAPVSMQPKHRDDPVDPRRARIEYGVGCRMRNPGRFLRDWLADLRGSGTTARRLFQRYLTQQYRFSSLGLLWAFAPPALTSLVLIGGQRAHVVSGAAGVPAAFYGVFGLALAQTFLEALNATRRVFAQHQQLLRRQNVPLEGLVVAALLDAAFNLLMRLVVVAVTFFVFSVRPVPTTVAIAIVGFVGVALVGAGLGLLVAPLGSLKRDVEKVLGFVPWVLFAVTPVFIPATAGTGFALVCGFNPLTRIFDGVRAAAYGGDGDPYLALRGLLAGLFLLFVGWLLCRIARPHVVERMLG